MLTEQIKIGLKAFKGRYNISSIDKWADATGVSKSTISRALSGTGKGMDMETLYKLVTPYGGSIDEILNIGAYSPEVIEKEELKTELVEKLDTVIEVIENSEELPPAPTEELKNALVEAQEYIANETSDQTKCVACAMYREQIAELKQDKITKNKWLIKLFGLSFFYLGVILALIVTILIIYIK